MDVNVAFFSYFCNIAMRRTLLILLVLLLGLPLAAQVRDRFDEALDRYEVIGARCLVLRDALDRGESIPQTELRTLLEQIARLRQTLSEATGEMSPAQQRRFIDIRDRFLAKKKPVPLAQAAVPLQDSLLVLLGRGLVGDLVPALPPPRPEGFALVQAGLAPRLDLGLMLGYGYGKWGGYLAVRMRPVSGRSDYTCDSEGRASYGQVWTSGKQFRPGWRVTMGGMYAPARSWRVFAGLGYGQSQVIWEDMDGLRVRVSDLSRRGLVLEAGALLTGRHWAVGAGLSMLKGKEWSPVLSAGYRF